MNAFRWILIFLMFGCWVPTVSQAGVFRTVIRKAAKVSDETPLKALDETAGPETRKMARELVEDGRKIDRISYSRLLGKQVENALSVTADPSLLRTVNTLDDAGKETVLLLCRGGNNVSQAIPDIARRANFLKTMDADTLCVLGRYDNLAREAETMNLYLSTNKIAIPKGMRHVTMGDFGNFFRKNGEAGVEWWQKNVRPHWKAWAAGGALAAILILPESYTDYIIEKAADGSVKIVHAGGKILGETLSAGERSFAEVLKGVFSSTLGTVFFIIGTIIFLIWFFSLAVVQKITGLFTHVVRFLLRLVIPQKKKDIGQDIG